MTALAVTFGIMCIILVCIVIVEDNRQDKLLLEKGRLEGRLEKVETELTQYHDASLPGVFLSEDDIKRAVSAAGYVPVPSEGWIRFQVQGENFFVDARRLPLVILSRPFSCKESEWEMERLREAGRQVADEMIMVKVALDEKVDDNNVFHGRIFIAALDRNLSSFQDNLKAYITLLGDGLHRMTELYEQHEQRESRDGATVSLESLLVPKTEKQVTS